MPLRLYDNNDWRSPTNIRIYNNGWQDATVGYVYNLGLWKVVFPDPIIPSIVFTSTNAGRDPDDGLLYVGASVRVTNGVGQVFAELFLGSTPSGTPIATQNFSAFYVNGNERYYETIFYSTSFVSNQNYCIRVTATSITENQVVLSSGAIYLGVPSVSITSYSVPSTGSFSVSWSSQNQYRWLVTIDPQSGFGAGYVSDEDEFGNPRFTVGSQTSHSAVISPPLLGNTQYILKVEVQTTNFNTAEDTRSFTSPNDPIPIIQITDGSLVQTCSTLGLSWTAQNTSYGYAKIYDVSTQDLGPGNGTILVYTEITGKRFYWTTQRTHTFTGLSSGTQYLLEIVGYNNNNIAGPVDNELTETVLPSVNAPTNFTATSDFYGKIASFTWTAATGNCTSVTGYRIEYKLNTSSTWSVLSDSIASSAVSFSAGGFGAPGFAPGRTYNFRIFAKSSFGDSATAATVNLTMNNNPYGIIMSGTNSIETFSSSVLTGQLVNADYENVSVSGVTITWSFIGGLNPPSGSSISPTSSVTNSSGQATTTFSSSSDDGTGTVYADAANLGSFGGGQRVMTVSLRSGLTPSLFWSATASGGTVFNFSYNSNYSYTGSISAGGSLVAGQSYASSSFAVSIPVQDGINQPQMSGDNTNGTGYAGTVTCTISNVWVLNPTVSTISVTSSRLGYNSATGSLSNSQPNRTRTTILYELINTANGNVMFSTNTNNNTVSYRYPGVDVGKTVRWRCTATFSDNSTSTRFSLTRTLG